MPMSTLNGPRRAIDGAAPEVFHWLARHPEPSPARRLLAHLLDTPMSGQTLALSAGITPYPGNPWPTEINEWLLVNGMLATIPTLKEKFTYSRVAALGPEWVNQHARWDAIETMVDNGHVDKADEYLRRINIHAGFQ